MSDEMLGLLAANGGVIQINFGSAFLTEKLQKSWTTEWADEEAYFAKNAAGHTDSAGRVFLGQYRKEHNLGYADIRDVVAHVNHVASLVGVEHVGIGSDFDGVGDSLPTGLKDVSDYPNLIYELLKEGYSEQDIRRICGENLLRVWTRVQEVGRTLQQTQ